MGFEVELQAQVTDGLDVYLRGGYTDSEIKEEHRTDGTGVAFGRGQPGAARLRVHDQPRRALAGTARRFRLDFFIRPDYQIIGPTWFYPDNFTERDPSTCSTCAPGSRRTAGRWSRGRGT